MFMIIDVEVGFDRFPAGTSGGIAVKKLSVFWAAVLAASVFLSGCSARTPASAEDFQKQAKALGYQVSEDTAETSETTKACLAQKDDADAVAVFYVFSDGSTAQERYALLKKGMSSAADGSTVDSSAYNKYVCRNGEIYYTIVRMDETVLSCKGTVARKDEIDSFVKALKY